MSNNELPLGDNNANVDNTSFSNVVRIGLMSAVLVILLSNILIAMFTYLVGPETYVDWIGTWFMCATPIQIMMGIVWQYQAPPFAQKMSQPAKGLVLTGICFSFGLLILGALFFTVGQGVLTPILIQCVVQSVCIVPVVMILFASWPVTKFTTNPVALGLGSLALCYVLGLLAFKVFYNYEFLKSAPFYGSVWDPAGIFNAITALTFSVTIVAVIMLLTMFEMWPVNSIVKDGRQPLSGIVGLIVVLIVATPVYYLCIHIVGMEPLDYMVRVPVSAIFGVFLIDNMMQFRLFENVRQPLKGLIKTAACAALALITYSLYEWLIPFMGFWGFSRHRLQFAL